MNIQEAVKAIQQNGEAMRRTCWLTTRIKICECGELDTQTRECKCCYSQPCEFGECTALVDERGKMWEPNIEELTATDWVVCNKVDDRVANRRAKESEKLDAVTDRLDQISKKLSRLTELFMLLPEQQAATFIIMQEEAKAAAWRGQKPTDIWEVTIPGRAMQEEGKR